MFRRAFVLLVTESDVPADVARYGELSVHIGDHGHVVPLIHYAGKGDAVTSLGIGDSAMYLLGINTECQRTEQEEYELT